MCIDYFGYNLKIMDNKYLIYDETQLFEKSIRLGFVKQTMQEQIFHIEHNTNFKSKNEVVSLAKVSEYIELKLGKQLIKEVGTGALSRYRFEFPELLFKPFQDSNQFKDRLFEEEILSIGYNARELIMSHDEASQKRITNNCTLKDVVFFQRFFVLVNLIISHILFKQKDKKKVIRSLIPHFQYETLINILNVFIGESEKSKELLELFTYKKDNKLDLQYTPFLKASGGLVFSNSIVSKSDLLRNCIAYSYLSNNQLVNQDDRESLVLECKKIFSKHYQVYTNRKFSYNGQAGEIDVLVISDQDIILIECKAPFNPTSNFELRASFDHITKASKQLDHGRTAFMDKAFRRGFLKNINVSDELRSIHTCIVLGNRLFNGHTINNHPIRFVRELDMLLNNGHINSEAGMWRVWGNEHYIHGDLIKFLSPNYPLGVANFESMEKVEQYMYVKGRKICFESYVFNFVEAMKKYDESFFIMEKNDAVREKLYASYDEYKRLKVNKK